MGTMAYQIIGVSIVLLNRLFRRRSKNTSKLLVTGLYGGYPPVTGGFPLKGQVTPKMFPLDDVIMKCRDEQKQWALIITASFL